VEEEVQHPRCFPFIKFPSVTYEIKYLLVNVACMVDKVAVGQFYLRVLCFLLSAITPPVPHPSIIQGWTMGPIEATLV